MGAAKVLSQDSRSPCPCLNLEPGHVPKTTQGSRGGASLEQPSPEAQPCTSLLLCTPMQFLKEEKNLQRGWTRQTVHQPERSQLTATAISSGYV